MSITLLLLLLFLCFSAFLYDASSALVSDGVILLSLLTHWTFVPPIINWNASDSIPCSWIGVHCDDAHNVVSLDLTHHGIIGQLGPEIGQLYHLQTLVLLGNGFSGQIPSQLTNCTLLEYLDLSVNSFSGQIPYSINKLQNLHYLSLSSNLLTGDIPSSIGNCSRLEELFLDKNHLSGKMPPEIGECRSLKKLHLYSNQLEGEIPDKLGMLGELEDLELSFNRLTGKVPVSIFRIQSLKHILLHNNSLFGELPLEMTKLSHLTNISLFNNQFSGVIPQTLGINSTLVNLDLMNNKFTGNIPPNLCFGKQLHILNLGFNQLQGGIPSDVGRCSTLSRLILKENDFTGSLPDFENNPNLKYMDISSNNISGPIPSSLENCTNLAVINLSMNKFSGLVPVELGKLVNLVSLDLSYNNLEGPLPPQLSNCTKMDHFDVGFNFLNGSFPSSLRSWTGITTLILRENHFTGGIPGFLSGFYMLRELQLGGNLFGGKIPQSIGTMQKLFYGLNLSANGLTGDIPLEIGNLKELQSLDVSANSLTGSIDVLVDLLSLIEVNISYNFFNGPVPNHLMKLLNSSPSSFMGNPHLCVSCSHSHSLSCTKTSYLKPCVNKSSDQVGISKIVIVIIELGSSIFISAMLLVLIHVYLLKRSKQELNASDEEQCFDSFIEQGGVIGSRYEEDVYSEEHPSLSQLVMRATESLNDQYIIGRGAHGIVYKAQLDQLLVFAVKKVEFGRNKKRRLSIMLREIQTIGMIKHRNLITYVDYWIGKDYGLILYEYMENGSLDDILHEKSPPTFLAWNDRLKIAVGIAHGIAYLHYDCVPPIMHRDIKPKNILLDDDMEPRIADFSIAQRTQLYEHSNGDCQHRHMLSAYVAGTPGYIAPENAYVVVPSGKSDVFSYGVVLLELITRKKAIVPLYKDGEEEQVTTLVSWARSVWVETGKIENIVDSDLSSAFLNSLVVVNQVTKVLILALRCTEKDRSKRPTMKEVIKFYYDLQKSGNDCRHAGAAGGSQSKSSSHQPKKPAASDPQEPWKSSVPILRPQAVHKSDAILRKPFEDVEQFYTLGKVLGTGTFAVTYLCTENSTGLEYACKSISKKKFESKAYEEDIKREIKIMQHLSGQPNIVEFKGAYEDENSVHVIMELCAGGELFDRIISKGHYSERAAASIFRQIVNVVQTCHFMGVMHRDLKPENLLLSSKGEEAILKATDFGLSSFIEEGKVYHDFLGSAFYVAPEVIQYRHGKECDIWSAGVMLYILLCGVPPFWAEDEPKIIEAVLQGHFDFERPPWPSISNNGKDLVRKMLIQDPKKRITSAEVLEHPWMNDRNVPDNPIDGEVLSRMKQFRAMSKLRKSALMNPNRGGEALLAVDIIDGRV